MQPMLAKTVGRAVAGLLLFGIGVLARPSDAAAESRYVWQKQNVATLPYDSDGDTTFFTRTRLCAQSYRRLRLVCWDTKTGAETLRYEKELAAGAKPTSLLYQLNGDSVTLAYQVGNKVLVRSVDLSHGTEQRAFEFTLSDGLGPVARTFGISGSSLVVVYRMPDPKDANLPKSGSKRPKWLARARVVSAENGGNSREFPLDIEPFKWELAGDTLYVERSSMEGDAVGGWEISTGKKRFLHPFGKEFIHGIGAGPNGVYVQLDTKVVRLDEKSGQVKGTGPIGKEGNPGPVVKGDRVYVCERGLHVFDLNLKRIARVDLPGWVIQCNISDGYAAIGSHHLGYLVDLQSGQLLASAEVRAEKFLQDNGVFDGSGLPLTESESGVKTRALTRLARVPAQEVQISGLPAGAAVLEDGAPVGAVLAHGDHQLDLFRPGFRPVRYKLKVKGGTAAKVDLSSVSWVAAPNVAQQRFDHAPPDIELTQIAAARGRGEQTFPYGSRGNFTDAGRRVGLEARNGLFARSLRTGRDVWTVPLADIEKLASTTTGSFNGPQLWAVLPQSRLALISSTGSGPGVMLGYDLDTGKLRWQTPFPLHLPPSGGEYYGSAAVEYSGALWYITSEAIYGHDLADGHLFYFHDFGLREGSWGAPVFKDGKAFINHRESIVGLDLNERELVMKAKVPGRGLLALGPDDASLLFVDDKSARLISFEGKSLAQSPQLAGGLDDNPVIIEPDAIFLCGQYRLQTHALDRKTLKPKWTFTNKNGPGGGQSLCPSLFSATQVATLDAKRTVILDRKSGKVLFDQLEALPNSRYMAADPNGFCFHIRKGSACLDR